MLLVREISNASQSTGGANNMSFNEMKNSGDYGRRKGSRYCQSWNVEQKIGDMGTGELLW